MAMNIVDALAMRRTTEPEITRVYSDDEREGLARIARAGGSMGAWAREELERIKPSNPEVLGSTN